MKQINIYADGACSGNQHNENIGGWGAILEYGEHTKELHGGERNTTNNRMEITALISAFEALTMDDLQINIYSDSSYIINCMKRKWYEKWRQNGWRTSAKAPVENQDLWERLLLLDAKYDCKYFLIKGHLNLGATDAALRKAYDKFVENNGSSTSYERFLCIAKMNNLADKLANNGIDDIRQRQQL